MSKAKDSYIRTSNLSLKFVNKDKLDKIKTFIKDYEECVKSVIDALWNTRFEYNGSILDVQNQEYDCPKFCPDIIIDSPLTARATKCAMTQALGIVKGILTKRKKDENKLEWLKSKNKTSKKLEQTLSQLPTKPKVKNLECEINSILVDVEDNRNTTFDVWLNLHSLYKKERGDKTLIPLKKHKQYLKWEAKGKRLNSILLSDKEVEIRFGVAKIDKKTLGSTIAVDQGISSLITTSRNDSLPIYQNGKWAFNTILEALCKKQKGSKAFKRMTELRKNYVNFVINKLDIQDIKEIKLEKIDNIRFGRNVTRKMSHFSNPLIRDKFTKLCEEEGVLFTHVDSSFNSQRCNKCGWTHKNNRNGKTFKCCSCSHEVDADENASQNILIRDTLFLLSYEFRVSGMNQEGFYWTSSGLYDSTWLELTVPIFTKTN